MSGEKKRLTDDEVERRWHPLKALLGEIPRELEADHLQAREDRKRLAVALRDILDNVGMRQHRVEAIRALLSEVGE